MAWTNLTFTVGSLLTALKLQQLQDNFAAMAAKDAGAPVVTATNVSGGTASVTTLTATSTTTLATSLTGALRADAGVVSVGGYTILTPWTASGASNTWTGIPSWATEIIIVADGVSTNGTSNMLIRIGDAGGIETTTYVSGAGNRGGESASTVGFLLLGSGVAANTYTGKLSLTLAKASAFQWASSGIMMVVGVGIPSSSTGVKALSAELTQVQVTTENGIDVFDAGIFNVAYR